MEEEEEEEVEVPSSNIGSIIRQPILAFMSANPGALINPPSISISKVPSPASKLKIFFDRLINLPPKKVLPSGGPARPRLIYIRDFPTLAPTSSTWYPSLLAAVRQRRRGALSRPTSAINHPTTIIFGMTAPLVTPPGPSSSSGSGALMSLLTSRSTPQVVSNPKSRKADWGEGEMADKARERRFRERLKRWENGDAALLQDLPKLSATDDMDNGGGQSSKSGRITIIGSLDIPGLPGIHPSVPDGSASFFRTSVLVPARRSPVEERDNRMARRREINELTMRMAVGAVGGILEGSANDDPIELPGPEMPTEKTGTEADPSAMPRMWDEWGRTIQLWPNVRHIADHAVGSVVASQPLDKYSLQPTVVPWSAVHRRWTAQQQASNIRQTWVKECLPAAKSVGEEEEDGVKDEGITDHEIVIEELRNADDLEPHESRLLPCIVDSGKPQEYQL
jgi:hypothetical protein